jgi:hypothetical protein
MSDSETWNAGPVPPAPPRPDAPSTTPAPSGAKETYATAPSWQRVGAVLGVIWAFPFLLTIPGWLTLRHRARWKRGEVPTPHLLIAWGYFMSAGMVIVAVVDATSG